MNLDLQRLREIADAAIYADEIGIDQQQAYAILQMYFNPQTAWELLDRLQRAEAGWVSVVDSLPEVSGEYLVYRPIAHILPANDDNVCIKMYRADRKDFDGIHEVTHWMPKPSAPNNQQILEQAK